MSEKSESELLEEIARLKAENSDLKEKKNKKGQLYMKVSPKGALSVYGLGRFPVTLYKEQWNRLLAISGEIKDFIAENDDTLKSKED